MRVSRETIFELAQGNTMQAYRSFKVYCQWAALEQVRLRLRYKKTEVHCDYDPVTEKYTMGIVYDPHLYVKKVDDGKK